MKSTTSPQAPDVGASTVSTAAPSRNPLQERRGADGSAARKAGGFALRYGMVWVLIGLAVVSQIVYPTFGSIANLKNMMGQNASLAVIAVGMTFVIIGGGFDLSVGAIYALGGVVFATMSSSMPLVAAVAVAIGVGLLAGLINAAIVTLLHVNPFVTTLATSSGFSGLAILYSHSAPVIVAPGNDGLGLGYVFGLPIGGVIAIAVFILGGLVLATTNLGQGIYAVGGSPEAARLAGIRVRLVRGSTYVIVGALSAFAGALDSSRLGSAQANAGASFPLLAITVVILGGTALMGGEGAMWRTAIGLLIIADLTNLFNSLAITTAVQLIVQCCVLVGAVSFDYLVRNSTIGRGGR